MTMTRHDGLPAYTKVGDFKNMLMPVCLPSLPPMRLPPLPALRRNVTIRIATGCQVMVPMSTALLSALPSLLILPSRLEH